MKFTNWVLVMATISFAAQAVAEDGRLRRQTMLAQNETLSPDIADSNKQGVIILNTNTNSNTSANIAPAQPAAVEQPATVVEAQPVLESKAEAMRKARQDAEVQTEQKIVEKLEESRLREEQERANRLFGNKFDAPQEQQPQPVVAPVVVPAATATTVVTPDPVPAKAVVAEEKEESKEPVEAKATNVHIEKIEIVQPEQIQSKTPPPQIESVTPVAPVAVSKAEVEEDDQKEEVKGSKYYVSGSLGAMTYDASNVKENFGGGVSVGTIVNDRAAIEIGFLYSNHYIDTFWNPGIYRELDQYDIGINAKYYLLTTRIRPYVGAGVSYIVREYNDRVVPNFAPPTNVSSEQTESVNLGLAVGADFIVNEMFAIGGGLDYSTNMMNRNDFNFANYGLPENTKALEEIDFFTVKVNAKLMF
ncbi:MAG: OmpW family outer membrane protein [Bdellovibrionales bacterium]